MSMKKAENVSCEERARQYPKGTLHADSGKLFCSCCNITLDHTRKGTIDRHLESLVHVSKRKASEELQNKKVKKQATVAGMFSRHTEARDARNVAVFELVEAFTAANIPLEKLDHPGLHSYLQNHIPNLGLLPASQHLRTDYQQNVFKRHKEQLKTVLAAASSAAIVTDEASDVQGRFGLHILFIPEVDTTSEFSPAAYLADIVYLEKVNAVTVSQAVLTCVAEMGVSYNNVSAFVTDNASYMSKAFEKITGILPNAVHCTCNAHILSLVGETWRMNFKVVDRLVALFKSIFTYCSARKRRYKEFLAEKTGTDDVPLPPVPVVTRWNSWFKTVIHHAKYIAFYKDFVDEELDIGEATNALTELKELLHDPVVLAEDVNFVAASALKLVELLTWFESSEIRIHLAYNRVTDLLAWAEYEASSATIDKYKKAFKDTADKLSQYYRPTSRSRFTQPGLDFLKAVRVFDFKQVSLLPCDELIKKIPGADSRHVLAEFAAYKAMAGDIPSETTVVSFWHASSDRFPLLSRLALRYLSVPTNSVDAERSVSQYTTVSAPQRQRLSTSNLTNQVIIAKNSKLGIE